MGELIHRWRGSTWTAMLTREVYGLHFSVGAIGRMPTDKECDAAFARYKAGLWVEDHMTEVTTWWHSRGSINPWVRHFVPDEEAQRVGAL